MINYNLDHLQHNNGSRDSSNQSRGVNGSDEMHYYSKNINNNSEYQFDQDLNTRDEENINMQEYEKEYELERDRDYHHDNDHGTDKNQKIKDNKDNLKDDKTKTNI